MHHAPDTVKAFSQALQAKGKQPATIESYCRDALEFLGFLDGHNIAFGAVEPSTLLAFQTHLREAERDKGNSVRRKIIGVRQFYRFLSDTKRIGGTPFDEYPIPSRDERLRAGPKARDIDELIHCMSDESLKEARDALIMCLLGIEGLKASELIELDWEDVLFQGSQVTLKIGGPKGRIIDLAAKSAAAFDVYRQHMQPLMKNKAMVTNRVFVGFKGRDGSTMLPNLTRHGLKFMLYELGEKYELKHLNTEKLRHHAIEHQLQLGRSAEQIMAHLGLRRVGNIAKHMAKRTRAETSPHG